MIVVRSVYAPIRPPERAVKQMNRSIAQQESDKGERNNYAYLEGTAVPACQNNECIVSHSAVRILLVCLLCGKAVFPVLQARQLGGDCLVHGDLHYLCESI